LIVQNVASVRQCVLLPIQIIFDFGEYSASEQQLPVMS